MSYSGRLEIERLSRRDLESLQSHLREIYSCLDVGEFPSRLVATLPKLVPSETTCYTEVDGLRWTVRRGVSEPVLREVIPDGERIFDRCTEHPLLRHYKRTRDDRVHKISDFLTRSEWHRLGIYDELFRKADLEHQLAFLLPAPAPLQVAVWLTRGGKDFSERELLLLNLLRPHLMQAYSNAESMARARQDLVRIDQAVQKLDRGIIAFTGKGRVLWQTERALRWVSEYFEPSWRAHHLPETVRCWTEHQRSLLSRDGDAPVPLEPLVIERAGKRLVVRMVSDGSEDQYLLLLEEQTPPLVVGSLAHLGLTRREEEVMLLVAGGKTNKEIAATLYVSPLTVRKHLENVYDKLGVSNRAEATARALEATATGK